MEFVVDSSVAAKWFLPPAEEPFTSEALRVLSGFRSGQTDILVPDLFWPEMGNILRKAVVRGRITSEYALAAIALLEASDIPSKPTSALLKDAFRLADAYGPSVYDATYVVLARRSGRVLLTADERLVNMLGSRFPLLWLGAL